MTKFLPALALLLALGDEELDKAAAKASAMTNYTFSAAIKVEGGKQEGGGVSMVVQVAPGQPWQLKAEETEAWRQGETLVLKDEEGNWKRFAPPRKGGGQDRSAGLAMIMKSIRAPHDLLKDIGSKLQEVAREEHEGGRSYSGKLTDEAAAELGRMGMGKPPGKKAEVSHSGRAKIWAGGEGDVTKVEFVVESTIKAKDREVTLKRTITYSISEVGTTKVEAPEEVLKALSD